MKKYLTLIISDVPNSVEVVSKIEHKGLAITTEIADIPWPDKITPNDLYKEDEMTKKIKQAIKVFS